MSLNPIDLVVRDGLDKREGMRAMVRYHVDGIALTIVTRRDPVVYLMLRTRRVEMLASRLGAWAHGGSPAAMTLVDELSERETLMEFGPAKIVLDGRGISGAIMDRDRAMKMFHWLTDWFMTETPTHTKPGRHRSAEDWNTYEGQWYRDPDVDRAIDDQP